MAKKKQTEWEVKLDEGYGDILSSMVELLEQARRTTARAVNSIMTATYWEIGRRIVELEQRGDERAEYGKAQLKRLASDLSQRFGRGFSVRSLYRMRAFYEAYSHILPTVLAKSGINANPGSSILPTVLTNSQPQPPKDVPTISTLASALPLPWAHYIRLVSIQDEKARRFYEEEALRGGWSVRQLDRQVGSKFYERTLLSKNKAAMIKKGTEPQPGDLMTPEEQIKDPYVLEFLDLKDEYSENDLEDALIQKLEDFLLELGSDFTFVGRQRRLRIGEEWYRIDLLFFHRRLRCLVVIDLKLAKFTHADAGQMHMYLNYAAEHWTHEDENPPVGLILCAEQDAAVAHYSLDGLPNKVMASEYKLALPAEKVLEEELERTKRALEIRKLKTENQSCTHYHLTNCEDLWQDEADACAFGLHVASSIKGPPEVEFDFGIAHVLRADSEFQIREALLEAEEQNNRIILLTNLHQGELGQDVVGRMAKSRVFPFNHIASLCSLFKAKELDRSICDPGISDALLEFSPRDGYPPVSAGVLDAGTVWRAVCRHVFEMGDREPDLVTLLLWATKDDGPQRYIEATDELRSSLRNRLHSRLGDAADAVLRIVDSGAGKKAVALAVTCQVIFGSGDDEVLDAAAARLEQYHQNKPISKAIGRMLGELANDAIFDLDRRDDPRIALSHLELADEFLKQFRCEEYSHRNQLSRNGYEQRLIELGRQIQSAIADANETSIAACERQQEYVADHRLAKQRRNSDQVSRTQMGVRLIRWLTLPLPDATSFGEQSTVYVKELAFADWAREAICRGDDIPQLSDAYIALDATVSERQSGFAEEFAKGLADWSSVGSTNIGVIGVEHVLEQVVAKVVAQKNNVLMIVLDGMSWAICHELLEDIRQDHWFESTFDEESAIPHPVIATVPSETRYSRTSLLSGELTEGDASTELRNFKQNSALVACSDRRKPPVLFHKKDITEGSRGALSEEVSKAILDEKQNVVGVVINAIDDRLANAQQIRDNWTIGRINPLGALLRLARDSGRVVILASDHGHVWHRSDAQYEPATEGSRWRHNEGDCKEGEIVVSGKRVIPADSIIVPWSETIHYKRKQHGYHGGATPQEMICPLVLLTDHSSDYSELKRCAYPNPDWWSPAPVATPLEVEPVVHVTVPSGPPTLFDKLKAEEDTITEAPEAVSIEVQPAGADWIDRLLVSQAYQDRKAKIKRHPPQDSVVRQVLETLNVAGGFLTPGAFIKETDMPAARLDQVIANIRRVLNVDGYEILVIDRTENKVELNIAKLKRQFDVE